MHEMQTIVADDSSVCLSVCLSHSLAWLHFVKTADPSTSRRGVGEILPIVDPLHTVTIILV